MSRPTAYPTRSRLGWRWPAWIRGRSRGSATGPRARLVRARLMQMLSLAGATVCIAIGPIWAGVQLGIAGNPAVTNDLAAGVDCYGFAIGAAERAELDHPARRRPREGMGPAADSSVTEADDLATIVQCEGVADIQAKRLVSRRTARPFSGQCLVESGRYAVSSMSLAALVEENYQFEDLGVKPSLPCFGHRGVCKRLHRFVHRRL